MNIEQRLSGETVYNALDIMFRERRDAITTIDLCGQLRKAERTVRWHLENLERCGKIKRVDNKKGWHPAYVNDVPKCSDAKIEAILDAVTRHYELHGAPIRKSGIVESVDGISENDIYEAVKAKKLKRVKWGWYTPLDAEPVEFDYVELKIINYVKAYYLENNRCVPRRMIKRHLQKYHGELVTYYRLTSLTKRGVLKSIIPLGYYPAGEKRPITDLQGHILNYVGSRYERTGDPVQQKELSRELGYDNRRGGYATAQWLVNNGYLQYTPKKGYTPKWAAA